MERMVKIISTVNRTVVVNRPEYNVRKLWSAKGQPNVIPFDQVQQLMYMTGFYNLLKSGVLYIENMQDKIDLGLEDEGTTVPTKIRILNDADKLDLLKNKTYDEFVKTLAHLPMEQAHGLVDFAVDNEIIDSKKTAYLKQLTGRDVMLTLARKRQADEAAAIQAEKDRIHKIENEGRRF